MPKLRPKTQPGSDQAEPVAQGKESGFFFLVKREATEEFKQEIDVI